MLCLEQRIIGTVGVTIAFNVPLNDALAKVAPNSNEGVELWANYLSDWTFWNHVRTVAALVATAVFAIASLTASHIAP